MRFKQENLLVWIDLETTGLNPIHDQILEIAVVITTPDLVVCREWSSVIRPLFEVDPAELPQAVLEMHTANGLLTELSTGLPMPQVQRRLLALMEDYFLDFKPPMCGSSVHFDRGFLKRYLPKFEERFSYRNIDISTLKELAQRWRPDVATSLPTSNKAHRATQDIVASMRELRHYINTDFIRPDRRQR